MSSKLAALPDDFLSSFLTLVRSGQLEPASFGAALFSYFKYPIVVFGLSFLTIGIFFIPIVTFYQGFMFSFAVSATSGSDIKQ